MVVGQLKKTIKSVALCAPAAVLRDDALSGATQGATYAPHHIPEYVDLPPRIAYGSRLYRHRLNAPYLRNCQRVQRTCPFVIHGTWDVVVPYTYGERYHQGYKNSQLILLPQVGHSFTSEETRIKAATEIQSL